MTALEDTDIYHAVISAFSLVSYADGHVQTAELSRLVKTLEDETAFASLSLEQLHDDVSDMVAALSKNYDKSRQNALLHIGKIKGNAAERDLVLRISRLTLIADDRITESEEAVLADIHETLGVAE